MLNAHIRIETVAAMEKLRDRLQAGGGMGREVRALCLSPDTRRDVEMREGETRNGAWSRLFGNVTWELVETILAHLPNLEILRLCRFEGTQETPGNAAALSVGLQRSLRHLPLLRDLVIYEDPTSDYLTYTLMDDIGRFGTPLTGLGLGDGEPWPLLIQYFPVSTWSNLHSLVLRGLRGIATFLPTAAPLLVTLQHLVITVENETPDEIANYRHFLFLLRDQLTVLSLSLTAFDLDAYHADARRNMLDDKDLIFSRLTNLGLLGPFGTAPMLRQLPDTMEEMIVGVAEGLPTDVLVKEMRRWPRFCALDLYPSEGDDVDLVKAACRSREVMLWLDGERISLLDDSDHTKVAEGENGETKES